MFSLKGNYVLCLNPFFPKFQCIYRFDYLIKFPTNKITFQLTQQLLLLVGTGYNSYGNRFNILTHPLGNQPTHLSCSVEIHYNNDMNLFEYVFDF